MNGGYVMLDFNGIVSGDVVDGIYSKCLNAIKTNKLIFIHNLENSENNSKYTAFVHSCKIEEESARIELDPTPSTIYAINVTSSDMVTFYV